MFNGASVLGTAAEQSADEPLGLGFNVTVSDEGRPANRGWAWLDIVETAGADLWVPVDQDSGTNVDPNVTGPDGWGSFVDDGVDTVAVVGFAAWERSFADQAGNYGRAIEHSTISSSVARSATTP